MCFMVILHVTTALYPCRVRNSSVMVVTAYLDNAVMNHLHILLIEPSIHIVVVMVHV